VSSELFTALGGVEVKVLEGIERKQGGVKVWRNEWNQGRSKGSTRKKVVKRKEKSEESRSKEWNRKKEEWKRWKGRNKWVDYLNEFINKWMKQSKWRNKSGEEKEWSSTGMTIKGKEEKI
jgi:hypothetical protein